MNKNLSALEAILALSILAALLFFDVPVGSILILFAVIAIPVMAVIHISRWFFNR